VGRFSAPVAIADRWQRPEKPKPLERQMKPQTMHVVPEESADTLSEIRNDLEIVLGKLEALEGLLAHLTDDDNGGDLVMFSLQYSAGYIVEDLKRVFDRLHTFEAGVRP
jgi:hypothetical protein